MFSNRRYHPEERADAGTAGRGDRVRIAVLVRSACRSINLLPSIFNRPVNTFLNQALLEVFEKADVSEKVRVVSEFSIVHRILQSFNDRGVNGAVTRLAQLILHSQAATTDDTLAQMVQIRDRHDIEEVSAATTDDTPHREESNPEDNPAFVFQQVNPSNDSSDSADSLNDDEDDGMAVALLPTSLGDVAQHQVTSGRPVEFATGLPPELDEDDVHHVNPFLGDLSDGFSDDEDGDPPAPSLGSDHQPELEVE
jgi:hypothetical protein